MEFPSLNIVAERYAKLYNVSLYSGNESYQIDVTDDYGIGGDISQIDYPLDFAGSDIAFDTLDDAIDFLINYRKNIKLSNNV